MNENTYLEQKNETMGENSFMKKLLKKRLNQKGLTLIELLAVIVILAIVAAIAIPAIGNLINNSRDKSILADASSILSGAKIAMIEGACDSGGTDDVDNCSEGELTQYVNGIDTDEYDFSAALNRTTNVWTVTYDKFAELNGETTGIANSGTETAITDFSITETELNTALNE